jgi:hypothetical protein
VTPGWRENEINLTDIQAVDITQLLSVLLYRKLEFRGNLLFLRASPQLLFQARNCIF